MSTLFILVPYSKSSSFRGTPRRAKQIYTLLASKRRVQLVFRPTLWRDKASSTTHRIEHLLFYTQIFFLFLFSNPSDTFLCITQEAAFPILPALFILSRKVTVDVHGIYLSEHHSLLKSTKHLHLGLRLLILSESILFRSNKVSFLFLTLSQYRFIRMTRKLSIKKDNAKKSLPFILPYKSLLSCPDNSFCRSNPRLLYFGGAQAWQGLHILDALIQLESPVLKYIFIHGINASKKYASCKHLFGGVSSREPEPLDFSYGLSFRSHHIRSSHFNFSSKIAYYITHDIIPLVPTTSSEACIAMEFGGTTFAYDSFSFAHFVEQTVSDHITLYQKRLTLLHHAYYTYFSMQNQMLDDI